MTTAFYRTGTVAVTQNSKVVTGTGTNWTTGPTKPLAGDVFIFNNKMYEIDNVVSDTEIRLYRNFEDSTASSKSYAIMRNASLNISARIAAQVAQVVNQKQIMVDEFHDFLTNNTDSTVPLTDTLGNTIDVTPIPMLDKDYVEKIGGIDSAVNQAVQDINDAFDNFEYPVLTAAQRQAIVDANNEKFAASGMVHMGNRYGSHIFAVNEGMYAEGSTPNTIKIGTDSGPQGTSKTNFMVTHIAGVVASVWKVNSPAPSEVAIKLPPAPDGTVIYDSTGDARGTGKANLNLLTEVDPKYGDSAEDLYGVGTVAAKNEACSRVFEGDCKNGDFRLGDNGDWVDANSGEIVSIANNSLSWVQTSSSHLHGIRSSTTAGNYIKVVPNRELIVNWNSESELIASLYTTGYHPIGSPVAKGGTLNPEDHTEVMLYIGGSVSGTTYEISDVSLRAVTEEVVTDRVDMFGLEQFDMVMKDGEIFDMIQSQSSTFGDTGVPTVTSVRPDSFFAVYDGQENIVKGKCVRWPDLTVEQKRKVAAYMKERLWVNEDGDLTFTSIRQRSIAGAGNGDWGNVNSAKNYLMFDGFGAMAIVQGSNDVLPGGLSINDRAKASYHYYHNNKGQGAGIFVTDQNGDNSDAYKGRCFFYVLGTVSRLNQGAYHPSLNPTGCGRWVNEDNNGWRYWYSNDARKASGTTPLFTDHSVGGVTASDTTGRVGSSEGSGRPDGRYYDAIYADGLGGVVDRRLPAYASDSSEEAAKVWAKVKSGTYRGLEKLVRTLFSEELTSASGSSRYLHVARNGATNTQLRNQMLGKQVALLLTDGSTVFREVEAINNSGDNVQVSVTLAIDRSTVSHVQMVWDRDFSVSGEFTQTDVIGDPADILQTEALKGGWWGSWIPVIPGNTLQLFTLTRKAISTSGMSHIYTRDDGATWTSGSFVGNFDGVLNGRNNWSAATGEISIINYRAFAKQTKPSNNKPSLNCEAGLGSVWASQDYRPEKGCTLSESLLGLVCTSSASPTGMSYGNYLLSSWTLLENGILSSHAMYLPSHVPLRMPTPNNNSRAVKALPYQIADNGQCSLGVQANELSYDSGDDVIEITSANLDENGVVGKKYRTQFGSGSSVPPGVYICISSFSSRTWDSLFFYQNKKGDICDVSHGDVWLVKLDSVGDWGDDGTMKITASGSDTFVDLNGNTNLSVVHELALPYGWTKNRARTGEQIEGVDL